MAIIGPSSSGLLSFHAKLSFSEIWESIIGINVGMDVVLLFLHMQESESVLVNHIKRSGSIRSHDVGQSFSP